MTIRKTKEFKLSRVRKGERGGQREREGDRGRERERGREQTTNHSV